MNNSIILFASLMLLNSCGFKTSPKYKTNEENPMYWLSEGKQKLENNDNKGAIADFTKAIELNPDYTEAYHQRATAKHNLKDFKAAIEDYNKAIELSPNDPNYTYIYTDRSASRFFSKDTIGALEDINTAIKIVPVEELIWLPYRQENYIWRATIYYVSDKYPDALKDYDKAIELGNQDPSVYVQRGYCKFQMKEYSSALLDFSEAIKLDKNNAEAYRMRGITKSYLGDREGACLDWKKASELGDTKADIIIKDKCKN